MQKFQDVVDIIGPPGLMPIRGANVTVLVHGTTTSANIFSDNSSTVTSNPLTTDSSGRYSFYAADGRYDLQVSGTGIQTTTLTDILLSDTTPNIANVLASSSGASNIGFTASASSAVLRTLQSKDREIISVTDYGATTSVGAYATNDMAFGKAFAVAHQILIPEGTFEISANVAVLQNTKIIAQGDALSKIYCRTDINSSAGLSMTGGTTIEGGLQLQGVGKIGTGLFLGNSDNSITGNFKLGTISINGFSVGLSIGNTYLVDIDRLNTSYNTVGIEASPSTTNSGAGTIASINIDNWYALSNDTYHIHANPDVATWNFKFGTITHDALTSTAPVAKMYFSNCTGVYIDAIYSELNSTVPAVSINNTNLKINSMFMITTGGIKATNSGCNLDLQQIVIGDQTNVLNAAGSSNTIYITNSRFPNSGNSTAGANLFITGSYLDNQYYPQYISNPNNAIFNASQQIFKSLTASTASPQLWFWNGDGYRHHIEESVTTGGLSLTSADGTGFNLITDVSFAAGKKIGFYGASTASQQNVSTVIASTVATSSTPFGFSTAAQANQLTQAVALIQQALKNYGLSS